MLGAYDVRKRGDRLPQVGSCDGRVESILKLNGDDGSGHGGREESQTLELAWDDLVVKKLDGLEMLYDPLTLPKDA